MATTSSGYLKYLCESLSTVAFFLQTMYAVVATMLSVQSLMAALLSGDIPVYHQWSGEKGRLVSASDSFCLSFQSSQLAASWPPGSSPHLPQREK